MQNNKQTIRKPAVKKKVVIPKIRKKKKEELKNLQSQQAMLYGTFLSFGYYRHIFRPVMTKSTFYDIPPFRLKTTIF